MATVRTDRDGRVMTVTLDNPPRNFMDAAMVGELEELTRQLEGDATIGAVVITGGLEGVFITHYDVAEIVTGAEATGMSVSPGVAGGAMRAVGAASRVPAVAEALERTPAAGLVVVRQIHELFLRMNRMDKVFVGAINGMATGGGCELALACDLRIMAEGEFMIGLPEMTLGLIPGAGGTQRLARALGPAKALELILEARTLSPQDAAAEGVVHRTAPAERLLDEARATAERLARRSPLSVRAAKRAVYEGSSRSLPEGLHVERAGFLAAASSPPALRAMRAYADEVAALPDGVLAPFAEEDRLRAWQEGTAMDLTA